MAFACPGCSAQVERSPETLLRRCPACRAWIRCRALGSDGACRRYAVELAGRPLTRRIVELPWGPEDEARLRRWLAGASLLTAALVVVLFVLARWGPG